MCPALPPTETPQHDREVRRPCPDAPTSLQPHRRQGRADLLASTPLVSSSRMTSRIPRIPIAERGQRRHDARASRETRQSPRSLARPGSVRRKVWYTRVTVCHEQGWRWPRLDTPRGDLQGPANATLEGSDGEPGHGHVPSFPGLTLPAGLPLGRPEYRHLRRLARPYPTTMYRAYPPQQQCGTPVVFFPTA